MKENILSTIILFLKKTDFFKNNFAKCWLIIERLAAEGKNTTLLQQLFQIITANRFLINRKEGKASVTPIEELNDLSSRESTYLRGFVHGFFSRNKVIALVDACLPDLDLEKLLGVSVEEFNWGDPLNTNKSQLIVCDTCKIGKNEFFMNKRVQTKLKQIINLACKIHKPDTVLIVTLNKGIAEPVWSWRKQGTIPKEVTITYYRSAFSRGITIDPKHRILILIGGPYLPKIAYLAETFGTDKLSAFRKSDMKSAFINLIGRVKDPRGQEKSVVYAAGITADEIKAFVAQKGPSSPLIARFVVQGADALDFEAMGSLFLHAGELRKDWMNIEEDLPILERILRLCDIERRKMPLSEILPRDKERVHRFVERYSDVLSKFSIRVVSYPNGVRLESTRS